MDNYIFSIRDSIKVFLYSTLVCLLTFPINGLSFGWSAIISATCYAIVTYRLLNKYKGLYLEVLFFIFVIQRYYKKVEYRRMK